MTFPKELPMIFMDRLDLKNCRNNLCGKEEILGRRCGCLWISSTQEERWSIALEGGRFASSVKGLERIVGSSISVLFAKGLGR